MQPAKLLADLQKFLTLLNPSLNLDEMLTRVARQLVEMFEVDHSGVLLFGDEDEEGFVIAEYPLQAAVGLKVPLTNYPLLDRLKIEQKPIAVPDAQNDPTMGSIRPVMRALGIQSILIIPLVTQGKIVGSLSLDAIGRSRRFTSLDLDFCAIIGNQIAVAVEYTHALETAEESRRQAQTLREVNRALSESLDLDEILLLILEQLEKVIPVDGSSIYLLVEEGIQLMARRGGYSVFANQPIIPLDRLWGASEIIRNKTPLLVGNIERHPRWKAYEGSPIKSWLGAPLMVRGEMVGILNMDGYTSHRFSEAHIPLALSFANQSAIAIYNARLYGQARKRAELLASVQKIGVGIAASLDLEEVFRAVTTSVLNLVSAGQVRIYLYDEKRDSFSLATMLADKGQLHMKMSRPRKDGVTATVARSGQSMTISNILGHPLYRKESGMHGFRAIASVPLQKLDKVVGVLNVFYAEPHHFTPEEVDVLHVLATQAAVALENARLYEVEVRQVEQELNIARQIQQGFFPDHVPDLPGWQIAARCIPARETGGDFYEFVERTDGMLGIVVGDVSGKSIPAAMLMASAQSVVSAKGSDYRSPAAVMSETNRLLYADVPKGSFVAASYALLSPNADHICFSNGGQPAPFFLPANGQPVSLIETPGEHLPLGVMLELAYQEMSFKLKAGDTLVFYTDGLVEQNNQAGCLFGFEGVIAALEELRGQPADVILHSLLEASQTFAEGLGQHDDVTIVVIQRTNP